MPTPLRHLQNWMDLPSHGDEAGATSVKNLLLLARFERLEFPPPDAWS